MPTRVWVAPPPPPAHAEVLAALIPLLERRVLHVAARAESIRAAPGFQLIATVTSAPGVPPPCCLPVPTSRPALAVERL